MNSNIQRCLKSLLYPPNRVVNRLFVLALCLVSFNVSMAQFYPFNPYNQGYAIGRALGQRIGSTIQRNKKYGRDSLRKQIKKWGQCNNGSLSLEHGAVAVYGSNGYFCSSTVDSRLSSKLDDINSSNIDVIDINITENGNFIIVYNGGLEWYGALPSGLNSALNTFSYGTRFKSISFNESGTYAITTSDGFKSNNSIYQAFYDDNVDDFGELLSVNICGDGAVFCYSDKTRYCGRIPEDVESGIRNFSGIARFVKFNKHGDFLICDKYGSYSYSIGDADASGNATTIYYDYLKERKKIDREKAYAKYEEKAHYIFSDSLKTHRVWCDGKIIDGKFVSLCTTLKNERRYAPTLNIDMPFILDNDFDGLNENLPDEGIENMLLSIQLSNGETITTNEMAIYKSWLGLGFRLSASLVGMRSDKRSLSGDASSNRVLVGLFMHNQIKTVTFKGRYTIDFSDYDTKGQLLYDFHRLADEAGRLDILPD